MKIKQLSAMAIILMLIPVLVSCSLFSRKEEEPDYNIVKVTNIDDMEDGSFYVKKSDEEYQKLYIGDVNYNRDRGNYVPSTSPSIVAWFGKDLTKIPTMYKGEKIVYKSSAPFDERFKIQRYFDLGYTMGISGLKKSKTNRYFFPVKAKDGYNINPNSSAGVLVEEFGEATILLESIGETPLRNGNVSVAGTVKGLEKGKTYANYMYLGTELRKFNLKADVLCLSATEENEISDYSFTKSQTVEFVFPSYYNSGYYFVGGVGFVRYVNSNTKYTEDLDMNVPNVYPKKDKDGKDIIDDTTEYIRANDITETSLYIDHNQRAMITVTVDQANEEEKYTVTPTVKLIGESSAFTLESDDGITFEGEFELTEGNYDIQIVGLNGRTFVYRVDDIEQDTSINGSGIMNNSVPVDENNEEKTEELKDDVNNENKAGGEESMADIVNRGE